MAIVQTRCEASGSATGEARKEKMETSYAVTGCKGNYSTVRSELMFLLYKNPDTPEGVIRNSLPLVGFFKNKKGMNT